MRLQKPKCRVGYRVIFSGKYKGLLILMKYL